MQERLCKLFSEPVVILALITAWLYWSSLRFCKRYVEYFGANINWLDISPFGALVFGVNAILFSVVVLALFVYILSSTNRNVFWWVCAAVWTAIMVVITIFEIAARFVEAPLGSWYWKIAGWLLFASMAIGTPFIPWLTETVIAKWGWLSQRLRDANRSSSLGGLPDATILVCMAAYFVFMHSIFVGYLARSVAVLRVASVEKYFLVHGRDPGSAYPLFVTAASRLDAVPALGDDINVYWTDASGRARVRCRGPVGWALTEANDLLIQAEAAYESARQALSGLAVAIEAGTHADELSAMREEWSRLQSHADELDRRYKAMTRRSQPLAGW